MCVRHLRPIGVERHRYFSCSKRLTALSLYLPQGEPEYERLKRELDDVKRAPRGLDSAYRSAAEMERHRAQLADAAIEEQLEVQTAMREAGAKLQALAEKKSRVDMEISKKWVPWLS